MTGEHWCSATGKALNKQKDQYVRIQWRGPDEKAITTIITKKRLARDAPLERMLLHWMQLATKIKPGTCILHKKKIGIKETYIQIEFYNWEEPKTETVLHVCTKCIRGDATKIKLDALKTLGKNPTFTPTISCGSIGVCKSHTPSEGAINCGHIALKFETIQTKVPSGKGVEIEMSPQLYCKRAHPNELGLPSEEDLDWNVGLAGSAIMLSNLEETIKQARKQLKKRPDLMENARKQIDEISKIFAATLGIPLRSKDKNEKEKPSK